MTGAGTPSPFIELGRGRSAERIPILYEDRSVIAVDKPAGWMLVPYSWQRTRRNFQAALSEAIAAQPRWVRTRNLRFLRHVHRLDAETSGILLLAKSLGGVNSYADLFESRAIRKVYLAVAQGSPAQSDWICNAPIGRDPDEIGRMRIDAADGKPSETAFRVLHVKDGRCLIEARPVTGRTHQIRLHLKASGLPMVGDLLYGADCRAESPRTGMGQGGNRRRVASRSGSARFPMGLRAVRLSFEDPFRKAAVDILADAGAFLEAFGMPPVWNAATPIGNRQSQIGNSPAG